MQIISRLMGGLGNQLFQYAAGRALCARHGAELILDDTLLQRRHAAVTQREYALDPYRIRARTVTRQEAALVGRRVGRPWRYFYEIGLLKAPFGYYREPHTEYDPKLSLVSGKFIMEGYWQSERYFADIAEELRRELQPVAPLGPVAGACLERIKQRNSVSLHVRRGDYVSVASNAAHYVACDMRYYRSAVAMVAERVPDPVFFVFTDTPQWVTENLSINYPMVLVSQPDALPAYDDLRLMSSCAHNIIANSSFSWWGAWLNPNPGKTVVAPLQWYRNDTNTRDLVPPGWHLL